MKNKKDKIKRCLPCECGSTEFFLSEILVYKAAINEDGELDVFKNIGNIVDKVECRVCGEEQSVENFYTINF